MLYEVITSVLHPNYSFVRLNLEDKECIQKLFEDRITSYNVCYTKLLREIKTDGFGMTDMKITVRFRRKPGHDPAVIFTMEEKPAIIPAPMI